MVSTFNLYLQVFLVVKELFTLPELMRSTPTLSGVHVARSWVFCEVFCRSLFVPLSFFFDQCIVTPLVSSNLSLSLSHIHTHTQTHTQKYTHTHTFVYILVGWFMVLNATFINISVVSWRRKPEYRENTAHLPQVTDNLYHIMLYASPWIYIYFTFITFFDICRKITTIWSYIYIRNMISNKGR